MELLEILKSLRIVEILVVDMKRILIGGQLYV